MSFTPNWNIETPVEGALDWNIALNNNFTTIDSILQSLRTNFASSLESTGPETHADIGSLWYSLLNNPGEGLFIKKTTGYQKLIDEEFADQKYLQTGNSSLDGTMTITQDGLFHFYNATTLDYAKIFFQTYNDRQNLTFEFGASPDDAIRFIGQTGVASDILHIYMDKVKSFKPLEVPTATQPEHAINKGQADLLYATASALEAALLRITALELLI